MGVKKVTTITEVIDAENEIYEASIIKETIKSGGNTNYIIKDLAITKKPEGEKAKPKKVLNLKEEEATNLIKIIVSLAEALIANEQPPPDKPTKLETSSSSSHQQAPLTKSQIEKSKKLEKALGTEPRITKNSQNALVRSLAGRAKREDDVIAESFVQKEGEVMMQGEQGPALNPKDLAERLIKKADKKFY